MSDEDLTRLLKPTSAKTNDSEGMTRPMQPREAGITSGRRPEEAPVTRMVSAAQPSTNPVAKVDVEHELVAGWLVVVSGPGRGHSLEIYFGMNSLGRATNQRIPLDFGDEAISRESHAFIVFDDLQQDFYVQHGGKSNLVRLNGKPVLAPMSMAHGDIIDIGATRLMFVPLCSESFSWASASDT